MGRVVKVSAGIFALLGAIAATTEIIEFWQRRAAVAPSSSEPRFAGEGGSPEAAHQSSGQVKDGGAPATHAETSSPTREIGPAPSSSVPSYDPAADRRAPEFDTAHVESLFNRRAIPVSAVPVMAIALDGESSDVELLEAALVQGLSSAELRLVPGFFKPAFRERGLLRAVYDGDTEILAKSGALAAVDRILLGRVERACRETGQLDNDLVTCDVGLHFKIIDHSGAIANAGHVAVAGAGFSEKAARDRAIEMLVQQHGERVISLK